MAERGGRAEARRGTPVSDRSCSERHLRGRGSSAVLDGVYLCKSIGRLELDIVEMRRRSESRVHGDDGERGEICPQPLVFALRGEEKQNVYWIFPSSENCIAMSSPRGPGTTSKRLARSDGRRGNGPVRPRTRGKFVELVVVEFPRRSPSPVAHVSG